MLTAIAYERLMTQISREAAMRWGSLFHMLQARTANMSDWQPEPTAPSNKWVLIRNTTTDNIARSRPIQAAKIGGVWWQANDNSTKLEQVRLYHHTKPVTDPNWSRGLSIYCPMPIGGPEEVYTKIPDEWCEISTEVLDRLVNITRIPRNTNDQ